MSPVFISKKGKGLVREPIKYFCSDGSRVSEATIKSNLSKSYRESDDGTTHCRGCGARAEGHAHIVPKSRCKQLHKTELIWYPPNYFKACNRCNLAAENITSEAFRNLLNYYDCLRILREHDSERYQKALNAQN